MAKKMKTEQQIRERLDKLKKDMEDSKELLEENQVMFAGFTAMKAVLEWVLKE
jgi:hypothetical protein